MGTSPQTGWSSASTPRAPRLLAVIAVAFLVGWFFSWSADTDPSAFTRIQPTSHYDFYVDAILAGRADLAIAVAPELTNLTDPYDPVANAPYRVNDLSYYEGRYYLYLGVTPVLVLLAPFKAITGLYLSERAATVVFCLVGLMASWVLLQNWQRAVAPSAPRWCRGLASAGLLSACGYWAVVRTDGTNQIPIAAAYAFASMALAFAARYLLATRPHLGWLVVGSTCFGLAIGARPNFAPAAIGLLVIPYHLWRSRQGSTAVVRSVAAIGLPLALATGALLAWNQLRFGQPLEFGQRLMLGAWDQRTLPNSSLVSAWENAVHYLIGPAEYHRYFPFVRPPSWQAVGLLLHIPLLWFAALVGWQSRSLLSPPGRSALLAIALVAGINLLILVLLPSGNPEAVRTSANSRYILDFQPYLALIAACAVILAGHAAVIRGSGIHSLAAYLSAAVLVTTLITLSVDLTRLPAASYRRLAEVLNVPTWIVEQVAGTDYGPLQLRIRFPETPTGTTETILTIGDQADRTALYVTYLGNGMVRFGLFNLRLGGPETRPISVTPGRDQLLEISIGSLYPPMGSPDYIRLSSTEISSMLRRVELKLDGQSILSTLARLDPASQDTLILGQAAEWSSPSGTHFTGELDHSGRLPLFTHLSSDFGPAFFGAFRLTVLLPRDRTGTQEPLVVSGVPQAGNFVYIRYVDSEHIQLGFDHWGTSGLITPVQKVDYAAPQVIEIDYDGLHPQAVEKPRNHVSIRLNGNEVLAATRSSYPTDPADITVGINSIGGSTCGYLFTGDLIKAERLPTIP